MTTEHITLGGGCFWCIEAVYKQLNGVISVTSGYSGGRSKNPAYKEICTGQSDHAEVIQIEFDNHTISFNTLIDVFFNIHDPTTLNQQGNDIGTQYRSIIFYHNEKQKLYAEKTILELDAEKKWKNPIVTELKKLDIFYNAEPYHQNFYQNNPENAYCNFIIPSKLEKIKKLYKAHTIK